eukprot:Clim_evm136s147 gene=Clim_evmTU136s147
MLALCLIALMLGETLAELEDLECVGERTGDYCDSYIRLLSERTKPTNIEALLQSIQYADYETAGTPYPPYDATISAAEGGYDVEFSRERNCYIVFLPSTEQKRRLAATNPEIMVDYELHSLFPKDADARNGTGLVYYSHKNDCGSCSTLDQLAVYLRHLDLTNPVRQCSVRGFLNMEVNLECLRGLGFKDACLYIWYHNTVNSRQLCLNVCLANYFSANNEPQRGLFGVDYCEPWDANKSPNGCKNTINDLPACDDFQWRENSFRLNSCLQCDECRSGPIFQKYAGRTRRNSGIASGIDRPTEQVVTHFHFYGIPLDPGAAKPVSRAEQSKDDETQTTRDVFSPKEQFITREPGVGVEPVDQTNFDSDGSIGNIVGTIVGAIVLAAVIAWRRFIV